MSAARILFCGVGFGHGGLASSFPPVAAALERRGFEVKVLVPHAADRGALGLPPGYETGPAFRWRVRSIWAGRLLRLFHLATFGRLRFLFARRVPHDAFVVYGASCCMEWCGYSSKPTWAFLHSEPEIGLSGPLRPAIVRDLRRSAARAQRVFAVSNAVHDAWLKLGAASMSDGFPGKRGWIVSSTQSPGCRDFRLTSSATDLSAVTSNAAPPRWA